MNAPIFYQYPIWMTGLIFFGMLLLTLEFGFRVGCWRVHHAPDVDKGGTGDIALNAMYALLGLVLAFTYSFTISRADHRKQAVIAEANAIGTAFLRAGLVSDPARTELRSLLRDYAATRVIDDDITTTSTKQNETIANSLEVQAKLWPATERMVWSSERGPIEAGIVQSINDVIDLHAVRLVAFFDRLPGVILWMLLLVAGTSLAVSGYNRGIEGNVNRVRMTALVLVLAAVVTTITDFDRNLEGIVRTSQQPLKDIVRDIGAALGEQDSASTRSNR